jgi:4-amino-4-deoxy-L-arabinose transferase-like glycosyltransferase
MQESGAPTPNSPSAEAPAGRPDWIRLALLLVLSTALHAWLITHTTVISRDTIGFVRYARMLERLPWTEALPNLEQHPLYPAAVLAASLPLRHFLGDTNVSAFVLASQLVSALGGILLTIPMYYLGRELFDRRVAFWAAALFQCLPVCAQITSDGLSDGLFVLLLATALLLAVRALRHGSVVQLALCGLASGLAYLARPEGLLVTAAALLVLGSMQLVPRERWPWRRALAGSAALLTGAAVMAGPYMAIIGGPTVKPSAKHLFHNDKPQDTLFQPSTSETGHPSSDHAGLAPGAPVFASTLAIWWMDEQRRGEPPWTWGINAVVVEFAHGMHYMAFVPAVLGLWWFCGRFRSDPGVRVVLVWCVVLGLLLFRVALGVHYLSERHMLALVMCGSIWAAMAALRVADALPGLVGRLLRRSLTPRASRALTLTALLVLVGWCVPAALRPLHVNRAGHRAAGDWLASHAAPADQIVDPYCWAYFYSGLLFRDGPAADPPPVQYVVVTRSKNVHARLHGVAEADRLAGCGTQVFSWTPTRQERKSYGTEEVLVFAIPRSLPK